jgi:hypothetical protein
MCDKLRLKVKDLIEGIDFNWIEKDGVKYREFTAEWLSLRGFCCNNSCNNCPYNTSTTIP